MATDAERYRCQVRQSLSGGDDGRDLAGSLGAGTHAAVRNPQAVTGMGLGTLSAVHRSGSCIGDETL